MREQNTPQQAVGVESCSGLPQSRQHVLDYGATGPEGRNPRYEDPDQYPESIAYRPSCGLVLWGRLLRLRALPFKETAVFQETGEAKYSGFKKILESESLETWRCAAIGMPTGGYSNKSEWDEVLTFPISGKPVVTFMWNIGQTIRPNGEVLEGNPPKVNEYMPLTADNHKTYYDQLMERTRAILEQQIRGHRTGPTK